MGHIFKIESNQAGTATANVDWTTSNATPYNKGYVDGISDTTTTQKEITSIPSPFARIELVKEAFDKIVPGSIAQYGPNALTALLHGDSIYHKTVSDTLDVAQIFFCYPIMQHKVDILVWNRNNCIIALQNSKQVSHQIVGKTLDMYLVQDAMGNDPYNFGIMQNMYILRYKGPGCRNMHIIGATSPATLFFSTANDESAISKHLCFGTDYAFDDQYASLDQRDPEFVKYLFALRYSYSDFDSKYPEVAKYMDAVYNALNDNTLNDPQQVKRNSQLQNAIDAVRANINVANANGQGGYLNANYSQIQFTDVTGKNIFNVDVNGMRLHQKTINVNGHSDFQIASTKPLNGAIPLVLPITHSVAYANLEYYGSIFGTKHEIPSFDGRNVNYRRLPGIDVPHPYLTISDFLDDKIIKLPANVNSNDFFDGNFSATNGRGGGYLLPILPEYFNYFSVDDLMGNAPSGRKTIEIRTVAGDSVEVTLRIPIQKRNEVEYKRIYALGVNADKEINQGAIVIANDDTMVGVFPPVRFANGADAHYRVALLSDYDLNRQSSCQLHNDAQGFFTPNYVVRNVNISTDIRSMVYFLNGQTFDCIRVSLRTDVAGCRERQGYGLIVPKFRQGAGNAQLKFAIDLGTSNTHIEYTKDANTISQPFSYNTGQPQMSLVCKPSATIKLHLNGEFVPEIIGDGAQCHFPMRTVLGIDKNNSGINGNQAGGAYVPLGNASPAFMYNKADVGLKYNDYVPNLKWRNDPNNDGKIRCYIESLLLMIRAKVIYEGGSVSQTQIKWFYPISMSNFKKSLFEGIWVNAYKKYFNPTDEPVSITESIAPYSYFQSTKANVTDVVTIDIGGGTTDIVVADSQGVKLVTSMRFAADAIFGNSLIAVQNGPLNGIIKQFKDGYINNLQGLVDLKRMLEEKTAGNIGNSSEVASFLFSLVENEQVKKENLETQVDFNSTLKKDSTQKVVFYIFYTAIIYHLAHLMKAKGLPAPKNIAFSGNGSKVVSILSPSRTTLEGLTAKIFDLIYTDVDVKQINLIINSENPKEATCKGGLLMTRQPQEVTPYKAVLLGKDTTTLVDNQRYSDVEKLYRDVEKEVIAFMDFITLRLPRTGISLNGDFGISKQYVDLAVKSFNGNDLKAYIEKGVGLKLKSSDVTINDVIEEPLFFYPIIGVINDLSEQIYIAQLTQQTNTPN